MRPRAYAWPEGHWDWYRHLAFKHGVRTEQFIHVGGQVDKTSRGDPLNPDDLPTQIGVVVRHIDTVLREFGATLADTVKLTAFYAAGDGVDETWFVEAVAEACRANGLGAACSGPVLVPVPLPWLALPGMRVEIEAVAMLGEYGQSFDRDSASPDGVRELPAPLNHALRCGGHVFVGGQSAAGGDSGTGALAYERLADALGKLGAAPADLVRLAAWYASETPSPVRGRGLRASRRAARMRVRRAARAAARAGTRRARRRLGGVPAGRFGRRAPHPAARFAMAAAGTLRARRRGVQ